MLLCSPVSVSLCLHLLAFFDLLFFSTRAPQPSFTTSLSCCTPPLCFLCLCLLCFVFHVHSLHHSSSPCFRCYTLLLLHSLITLNNNNISSFVLHTYSLCAPCACYLTMLLHALSISSALPHHHANSSASLAVKCMRPSSLGVISRFLHLSNSRDSSSSLLQSSSTSMLQLQASTLFHLSISSMTSLHPTGRFLETLQLL
jgi:hypothetical protein